MALQSYIFGAPGLPATPEALTRQQKIIDALTAQAMSQHAAPSTVGEAIGQGLSGLGDALLVRGLNNRLTKAEKAGQASAATDLNSLLSGTSLSSSTVPATSDSPQGQMIDNRVDQAFDTSSPIYSGFIDTVKKGGVTNPNALAAIAATGRAESSFSPENANRIWNDGANNAGGIMSWNGPRLAALENYVKSKGGSGLGTPEMQAQFLLQENPQLIASLNNAGSLSDAMALMNNAWRFKGYDQPDNPDAKRRLEYAQAFLPTFQSATPAEAAIAKAAPLPQPAAANEMASTAPVTASAPTAAVASNSVMMPPPPVTATPQAAYGNGYANGVPSPGFGGTVKGSSAPADAINLPTVPVEKGPRIDAATTDAIPPATPAGRASPFMPFLPGSAAPAPTETTPSPMAALAQRFGNSEQLAEADPRKGILRALLAAPQANPRTTGFPQAPGQGDARMQAAMRVLSNPFSSKGAQLVAGAILKNELARNDPNNQLDAAYKRAQIAHLMQPDLPSSVQEYNFYRQQAEANGQKPLSYNDWNLQSKKAAATTINNNMAGGSFNKQLDKNVADSVMDQRSKAVDAANIIKVINEGRSILDQGAITGTGANYKVGALKLASQLGIPVPQDAANNTQAFQAVMGQAVGAIIKQFGSGTGLSDADRKYAERIAGGDVTLNEDAIRHIFRIADKAARAKIEAWQKKVPDILKGDMGSMLNVSMPPEYSPPANPSGSGTTSTGVQWSIEP